jgi:uridylate kinase
MLKNKAKTETIVISVGGSLIVPEGIDTAFLASLKQLIEKGIKSGKKFIVITGGGRTAGNHKAPKPGY